MVDSTLIEFDEPCKLLIKSENSVGNQIKGGSGLKQETRKRYLTDLETIDHQQDTNSMDLELKLSPPKVIISKGESSKSSSTIFSQENYASSSSTNSSNYEDICGSDCKVKALPSVILMGCTHCYLYAMVSEAEPECPKCKTSILLDIFRENPSKKCKKT